MIKNILGLDLGTTSIGWAHVKESDDENIPSSIERIGVRVIPLTTDEQTNFEKGKPISINADRTLKRGARRNLQRYKQRRANLINVLIKHGIITPGTVLAENKKQSTHVTYALRAKAASEKVGKDDIARILLMINKKRGYKSSRKTRNEEEGQAIDGMSVAKKLYDENLTPGQLCNILLKEGKKDLPDFYRSDLNDEFEKVWNFQKSFYPTILTEEFKKEIEGKGQRATAAAFWNKYGFNTAEIKGTRDEKKLKTYDWRSKSINTQLSKEETAYVLTEINNNINNSSGYLGAISDRSKELYFNKETIGQYIYKQLVLNPHTRLKNQVFYRQDYMDEFEVIWETQAKFHKQLTPQLKEEIRDIIIFYQRRLKSQKGLISFCEFESKKVEIKQDDRVSLKTIGYKVAPKSSPLFQEFKIWQNLNNLLIQNRGTKEISSFDQNAKQILFNELNVKGNLSKEIVLQLLGYEIKNWDLNFPVIEGNRTNQVLYEAYLQILELEGYDTKELLQVKKEEDHVKLSELIAPAATITDMISSIFHTLGIKTEILSFNSELEGKEFEKQSAFKLWHLLYSYESDNSTSGNEKLYGLLQQKFGFAQAHAKILANVKLPDDYGSLSSKAMRRIFPFIREHKYDEACGLAGYNHSASLTKEENEKRILNENGKLSLLPKNSLRNPVVEKILNQMVNIINNLVDFNSEKDSTGKIIKPFRFDEIRIELSRELKKNAKERSELFAEINKNYTEHEKIRQILIKEDGIKNPTRNDIIRYKLYQELKNNGYKTLYSNTYISREKLFSKEFDIEHIIPQALMFDNSFSNKTLCVRQENLDKGDKCAYEFIGPYFGEDKLEEYKSRVEMLYRLNLKSPGEGINKAKYKKLMLKADEIGQGFIERDLRNTQYIAKKARQMLLEICKAVVPTTGSVTDRLREDWGLINIMQELNIQKYRKIGLTEMVKKKDGGSKERIIDWSKRNDHRHHAMDALTVAFTKHSHIQYLNNLNARKKEDKKGREIYGIEQKETELIKDNEGNKKRKFKLPLPSFREEAKKHLENVLVSFKAKNKVVTKNVNKFKIGPGIKTKVELTPRGQLHKETIYGKLKNYKTYEEKVSAKFDEQLIQNVASPKYRVALLNRLKENNNDPKKAFTGKNSLEKKPLYLDDSKEATVPQKIKIVIFEDDYTVRKEIVGSNPTSKQIVPDEKGIKKIIDKGIQEILLKRLKEYKGNAKEAFSNLDKNPIWLNKEKGVAIKRVTIRGVANAEALHFKKNHLGEEILDENGNKIGVDFVSTGNNHHVAIYKDADGNLQENIVSLFDALRRIKYNVPVIIRDTKQLWSDLLNRDIDNQEFLSSLPKDNLEFLFTMKQNEYFVFPNQQTGFIPNEIDLLNPDNYKLISPNLFRVQKIATRNYSFRHHLETTVEEKKELKDIAYRPQLGLNAINGIVKVRINHIGQIVKVGEY